MSLSLTHVLSLTTLVPYCVRTSVYNMSCCLTASLVRGIPVQGKNNGILSQVEGSGNVVNGS